MIDPKKTVGIVLGLLLLPGVFALVFPKETIYFDRIAADYKQVGVVYDPEIRITSVGVVLNSEATRARITVQAMPDCPENAPYQVDVLQCFFISAFNIEEENIITTEVSFKVPREWIIANNFDKDKIELRRYSYSWNKGGVLSTWKSLSTTLTEEQNEYYRYTATGDGFDYFSIVGTAKAQPVVEEVTESVPEVKEEEKVVVPAVEVPAQIVQPIIESPQQFLSSYEWVSIGVIVLLSVILTLLVPRTRPTAVQQSDFNALTKFIQGAKNQSEDELWKKLQEAGWEDWQITLAFNEVRKKN